MRPRSVPRRRWVDPEDVELMVEVAELCFVRGEYKRAGKIFEGIIAARPDLASAVAALGVCTLSRGMTARARRQFKRALELDPSEPCALLHLADLMLADGGSDQAVALYRRCRAADEGGGWGRSARQALEQLDALS